MPRTFRPIDPLSVEVAERESNVQTLEPPALDDEMKVYTVKEAAAILQINPDTCYDLVRMGQLAGTRIGPRIIRISRSALVAYINGSASTG